MPASPARIAANRANAQKSTGPRTAEGKARARANAVKHGLTGAGVAPPGEAAAAVEERFLQVQEELAPATLLGAELAHQMALMMVRRREAARAGAAHRRVRVRRARAEFDRARREHAGRLLDAIEASPRAHREALLATPEGVDRLVGALGDLLADLTGPAPSWAEAHHRRLDALLGFRPDDLPLRRPTRYSAAILGDFEALAEAEFADLPDLDARQLWAQDRTAEVIAAEVARLGAARAGLDHAAIDEDRADAAECALLDVGREAELARRYEAAAGREFSRALRDFHLVEAAAAVEPGPAAGPGGDLAPPVATGAAAPASPAEPEPGPASTPIGHKPSDQDEMGAALASFGGSAPAAAIVPAAPAPVAAPGPSGWAIRPVHLAETAPHAPPVGP